MIDEAARAGRFFGTVGAMFTFTLTAQDGAARAGTFSTPRGDVSTPCFMPVGTHGAVKGVSPSELVAVGSQIILANTYHLHLRPGEETVAGSGGLHGFTGWAGPMLTDSGGFQVFSLGERGMGGGLKAPLREVTEEGIRFHSHLDGSLRFISPEDSVRIQQRLGADVIMAFDQPVYGLTDERDAEEAMRRTHRWLDRSARQWKLGEPGAQALFGIVQGGIHGRLHRESAAYVAGLGLPGNAIGGLSVGEGKEAMREAVADICRLLPEGKPRYFMGLGEPHDLIDATLRGVDLYDCVAPSRLARHGAAWDVSGAGAEAFWASDLDSLLRAGTRITRVNLGAAINAADPRPFIHPRAPLPPDLKGYSRAALRHFLMGREMLGYRILTLHNVAVLHRVTELLRAAIGAGKAVALRDAVVK